MIYLFAAYWVNGYDKKFSFFLFPYSTLSWLLANNSVVDFNISEACKLYNIHQTGYELIST